MNMRYGFEMTIPVDGQNYKLILSKQPFYSLAQATTLLHKHHYAEIHMLESGNTNYLVGNRHYSLSAGSFLAIPKMTFHKSEPIPGENGAYMYALIDTDFPEPAVYQATPGIFSELLKELKEAYATGYCGRVPAYLTQIFSGILCSNKEKLIPIKDRRYIIDDYLFLHYAFDISLEDLAAELNLSPRQTARLVAEYTGNPFRQEIPKRRIEAAKHLLEAEHLNLEEVAEQVGYSSYSSFWKAFHKFS